MAGNEEGIGWGKMGSASAKFGAKVGKKVAQSEAGRAAGKAAVKGATEGATDELCNRYFGDVPSKESKAPPKKEEKKSAPSTSEEPEDSPESTRSRPTSTPSASGTRKPSRDESPSFGKKISDFSSRVKQATTNKIQDVKASREPRFTGPTQTPESAQKKAEAILAKKRIKTAIATEADWGKLPMCEAMYNFRGEMQCDLEFRKGQRIAVICKTDHQPDWWEGRVNGKTGIFPSNYVKLL